MTLCSTACITAAGTIASPLREGGRHGRRLTGFISGESNQGLAQPTQVQPDRAKGHYRPHQRTCWSIQVVPCVRTDRHLSPVRWVCVSDDALHQPSARSLRARNALHRADVQRLREYAFPKHAHSRFRPLGQPATTLRDSDDDNRVAAGNRKFQWGWSCRPTDASATSAPSNRRDPDYDIRRAR